MVGGPLRTARPLPSGTRLLAAAFCHCGAGHSVSPVEDAARRVRRSRPGDALRRGAGVRLGADHARGSCHPVRGGTSGSVGAGARRRRPLRGARVDRADYRLFGGGRPRDGSAGPHPDHAPVRPRTVRRLGRQPRAARLRGVRHPCKPRVDHRGVPRTLPTCRTRCALHGGPDHPGLSARSTSRHRPVVSSRAIRPVADSRAVRAAMPNGGQPAWSDEGACRRAGAGAARQFGSGHCSSTTTGASWSRSKEPQTQSGAIRPCSRSFARLGATSSSILLRWRRLHDCFRRRIGTGWTTPTPSSCPPFSGRPGCSWAWW